MKKVIKVNLGMVMALFAAFGLMSFNLYTNIGSLQQGWYAVDGNGDLDATPLPSPPDGTDNCEIDFPIGDICAVEWTEEGPRPDNLTEYELEASSPRYAKTNEN